MQARVPQVNAPRGAKIPSTTRKRAATYQYLCCLSKSISTILPFNDYLVYKPSSYDAPLPGRSIRIIGDDPCSYNADKRTGEATWVLPKELLSDIKGAIRILILIADEGPSTAIHVCSQSVNHNL